MNCQTLSFPAATAALALVLAGCASEPPPRYSSYTPRSAPPPQSYGTVSVRYVQPAATAPAAPSAPASEATARRQAHMRRALAHLQNSKAQLNAGTVNVGGHRTNAIQAVDEAIGHVQSGIEYGNSH